VGRADLLLFDSDLFILCAGTGLLPNLIEAAGFELSNTRRLDPLPHMLRKGRIPKKYSPAAIDKAEAWCSKIPGIEKAPSETSIGQLIQVSGIDPGEALLFALTAESDAVMATGDKRACIALQTSQCPLKPSLEGKILCLETALWLLLKHLEYPRLARALTPARDYNQTLRILLSQGEDTPEESFRSGLRSYSEDLVDKVGHLLLDLEGF
jgi:hypothetical protein